MRTELITAVQLATRAALAAGLSLAGAGPLHYEPGTYAVIAAVVVTDLSPVETRSLALQRMAGTAIGAVIGGALSRIAGASPVAVGSGVLLAIMLCRLLRLPAASKLAGFLAGIILLAHSDNALAYSMHRSIETIAGIAAAVAVSWVPRLIRVPDLEAPAE